MATTKKPRKRKSKRETSSYLNSAKELMRLVPKLTKYKTRKTLKPGEKYRIRYYEKQLAGVTDLHPITAVQAKRLGKGVFRKNIRVVRLPGVDSAVKITVNKRGEMSFSDQDNYKWIYWPLSKKTVRTKTGMKLKSYDAFTKQFPIDIAKELARTAFKNYPVQGVTLWTHAGRTAGVFDDYDAFELWVNEKWNAGRYMRLNEKTGLLQDTSDPGAWILGIAILIENPEYTAKRKALKLPLPK